MPGEDMHRPDLGDLKSPNTPVQMTYRDVRRLVLGGVRLKASSLADFAGLSRRTVERFAGEHLAPVTSDGRRWEPGCGEPRQYDLLAFLDAFETAYDGGERQRARRGTYGEKGTRGLAEVRRQAGLEGALIEKAQKGIRRRTSSTKNGVAERL